MLGFKIIANMFFAVLGLVLFISSAYSASVTSDFFVTVAVNPICEIETSMPEFTFGSFNGSALISNMTFEVNCNPGTRFSIGLDDGLNYSNGTRNMRLVGGSELIAYQLYTTANYSNVWGNTEPGRFAGTGIGDLQQITVYGKIPVRRIPEAGVYNDRVMVTLFW
jgi:spore coat protein U-like protein